MILTGEYNHGYPAVLKNAIDVTFVEWRRKPVTFVGWGNVGGARAVEQLRMVAVEFEMERDVLGLWAGGEGAKQWMSMLTELRNRGVADVFIVCCDGLKGRPDAIVATWPLAKIQTCVVAPGCNSLRYASKADWAEITAGLKNVYTAATITAAESASPNSHGCRPYADR